jgi:hypothetical protein
MSAVTLSSTEAASASPDQSSAHSWWVAMFLMLRLPVTELRHSSYWADIPCLITTENGSPELQANVTSLLAVRNCKSFLSPCRSSGGRSPTSHRGSPDSSPSQVIWDFLRTKRQWGHVFPEYFGFSCQAFHRLLHSHHNLTSSRAGTIGQLCLSNGGLRESQLKQFILNCVASSNGHASLLKHVTTARTQIFKPSTAPGYIRPLVWAAGGIYEITLFQIGIRAAICAVLYRNCGPPIECVLVSFTRPLSSNSTKHEILHECEERGRPAGRMWWVRFLTASPCL